VGKKDYDKTLYRLLTILTKISNNEEPTTKELASEFGVTVRTIQKDIYERLYNFPITKNSMGRLIFHEGFSLKRTILDEDELIFLNLALSQFKDVADIDKIQHRIFQKLINKTFYNPYYIKQDDIEDIDIDSPTIELLERLIQESAIVKLTLSSKIVEVELYKIVNYDGFWYLFAKDIAQEKTKVYKFSDIKNITPVYRYHKRSYKEIEALLEKTHSAFFDDGNSFEVLIKVYKEVAPYFKNKDFLTTQKIEQEYEDGSIEVSFEVSHDEDVDNIIKSWLPHIEILEPQKFRQKLLSELKNYIQRIEQ